MFIHLITLAVGPQQLTATSCDGQVMQLSCTDAYIEIDNVFYGRKDDQGLVCPHRFANHTYTQCETDNTAENVVVSKCVGNKQCEIDVKTDIWNVLNASNADSCPNEYKYLQVSYSCNRFIEGKQTQTAYEIDRFFATYRSNITMLSLRCLQRY